MARPTAYPAPEASRSTYVAIRDAEGEIDWDQMRIDRPIPCYLHPLYAAPETNTCLHRACLQAAMHPHQRGLLGNRIRILQSGWRLRGDDPVGILDDIALELLTRYRKIDVPVTTNIASLLAAVEAVGVRHWGWACWEPDWVRGAGRTTLQAALADVGMQLDQIVVDAHQRMANPLTHSPEQVMRNLELAALLAGCPSVVIGYMLGEVTVADLVRLGTSTRDVEAHVARVRDAYLGLIHATI